DLHVAVKTALRLGAVGFDAIKHLVLCRVEKRPPKLDLEVYPYLPRAIVAKISAASYLCLVSGGPASPTLPKCLWFIISMPLICLPCFGNSSTLPSMVPPMVWNML